MSQAATVLQELREADLTPSERALCVAAAAGRLLDARPPRGGQTDARLGQGWAVERHIRGQLLRQLLAGHGDLDDVFGAPRAIRLRGARIVGPINLGGLSLRVPLELNECHLHHPLELANAAGREVILRGSHLSHGMSARGLRLSHSLNLGAGFSARGRIDLRGAAIDGNVECERATLAHPGGAAFVGDRLAVGGSASFWNGTTVTGETSLVGAHIHGDLYCDRATFSNPTGCPLTARGLTVDGAMSLRGGTSLTGEASLLGAHVGLDLDCEGASFSNPDGSALIADRLTIAGNMELQDGTHVTGELSLLGAHIGGDLTLNKLAIDNAQRSAITARGMIVDGNLLIENGTTLTGQLSLRGAEVRGYLKCERLTVTRPGASALLADRLAVGGSIFLRDSTSLTGKVVLDAAQIGGNLECTEVTVTGALSLAAAHIRGHFTCERVAVNVASGNALDLSRATVDKDVTLQGTTFAGSVDLTRARVGGWYDEQATWPTVLYLDGFSYDSIDASETTVADRLEWLKKHDGKYAPQPYQQLAGVYRGVGNDQAARTVAIAKQKARRADHPRWWVRWPSRAWSFVLRWTIGYGYRPALVLLPFALLFVAGVVLFGRADHEDLHPLKTGAAQPDFDELRYTLDLLLPVANLRQRDAFVAHGHAAWLSFGLSVAGWLLAAVLVTGLTGVFKRD